MPAPSDPRAALRIGTSAEMADAVTRSHLADGRVVGWYGDPRAVVDAEVDTAEPPAGLAERHGRHDFWARWTAAECRAKLADVPIVLWLREHGLDGGTRGRRVTTWTDAFPGVTVSVGVPDRL